MTEERLQLYEQLAKDFDVLSAPAVFELIAEVRRLRKESTGGCCDKHDLITYFVCGYCHDELKKQNDSNFDARNNAMVCEEKLRAENDSFLIKIGELRKKVSILAHQELVGRGLLREALECGIDDDTTNLTDRIADALIGGVK